MTTISEIIALWPSQRAFAEDIGVPLTTASSWKLRGSIPPRYWATLVETAAQKNLPGINYQSLAKISAATLDRAS